MPKITIGVTGGIAAYKSIDLVNYLLKGGHEVHVVMTEAASRFVSKINYEALGARVWLDSDEWSSCGTIRHIDLPPAELRSAMLAEAMPEPIADRLLDLERFYREGRAGRITGDVAKVTGEAPRSYAAYVRETAATGVWDAEREQPAT